MKKIFLIIALIIFGLISCEETVENPNLPYEEQLVISGLLGNGEANPKIRISKTLPPLEEFNYTKAIITDAQATLDDGTNQYNLKYNSAEQKYIIENFTPEIRKSYTLTVKWGDKTVKGYTYIPDTCEFVKFDYEIKESKNKNWDGSYYYYYSLTIYAVVKPPENAVFTGGNNIYNNDFQNDYSTRCVRYEDRDNDDLLKVQVVYDEFWSDNKIPQDEVLNILLERLFEYNADKTVRIYSWDKAYYNYFTTRYEGEMDDFIFGTSGKNIRGNIENAIGFFYGYSYIERQIELTQ